MALVPSSLLERDDEKLYQHGPPLHYALSQVLGIIHCTESTARGEKRTIRRCVATGQFLKFVSFHRTTKRCLCTVQLSLRIAAGERPHALNPPALQVIERRESRYGNGGMAA